MIDLDHMPEGCGTWPAIWLLGDAQSTSYREIDILEGVNSTQSANNSNATTIWTRPKCIQNLPAGANCRYDSANIYGCSQSAPPNSFGHGFNKSNGGVFVLEFVQNSHLKLWFFFSADKPQDLASAHPDPSTWNDPYYTVDISTCTNDFKDMNLIINTMLCGGWDESDFPKSCSSLQQDCET